ncbi:MAG: iron-containing alcohol dehydrogenase, partial [Myxococcota bacterium]
METPFGPDALSTLRETLVAQGSQRVLVLTGPSRRFLGDLESSLEGLELEICDGAKVHVPAEVVASAAARVEAMRPDALIALGGGAAIGLGKALRRRTPALRFYVVPTTFSGSERTSIWGVTDGIEKKTGRDPAARPDGVYYVPRFVAELPARQRLTSLMNALAHPVSALSTGSLNEEARARALAAIDPLVGAALLLAEHPSDAAALEQGLRGSSKAGEVLEEGTLGRHHQLAHFLGGRFAVEHSALHAVLLPHTVRSLLETDPDLLSDIERAAGVPDLSAQLFDLLRRQEAPLSLEALGIDLGALDEAVSSAPAGTKDVLQAAATGRRPSNRVRSEDWGLRETVACGGAPIENADTVAVVLHGRGQGAERALDLFREIAGEGPRMSVFAPHAPRAVWYTNSYRDAPEVIGAPLELAVAELAKTVAKLRREMPRTARLVLFGFSQGACLAVEAAARFAPGTVDAVVAFAGARIGPAAGYGTPPQRLSGTSALLGIAEEDPWVDRADVEATARWFEQAGASTEVVIESGAEHRVSALQRLRARELLRGQPRSPLSGFGGHESEALPGALPSRMNSPRRPPYGLYAEQINASGFVAERHANRRTWTYRVRPTAQHRPFEPLSSHVSGDFDEVPNPNLTGYAPLPLPTAPTDFVDGLHTFGGAGRPELRRGYAIHLYAANRSMEGRAFVSADGELLLVPEEGKLVLQTELGVLDVPPGHVAIVPRGIRFSVHLPDGRARGYVAEVYGRAFELPDRGPVGANGLTEERHFKTPQAEYEDRLSPGYEIVQKLSGCLWRATQDYSPHDVVAWHGNLAPRAYDLMDFSPVTNARFDHPDPSIYSVLSAPLDERGAHGLDLVFFPPRWDVSEGTFRPPFFHRNATMEINGIIRDPDGDTPPFMTGGWF